MRQHLDRAAVELVRALPAVPETLRDVGASHARGAERAVAKDEDGALALGGLAEAPTGRAWSR